MFISTTAFPSLTLITIYTATQVHTRVIIFISCLKESTTEVENIT